MGEHSNMIIVIALGIICVLGIITMSLSAATLGTFKKQYNDLHEEIVKLHNKLPTITTTAATSTIPTTAITTTTTTSPITTEITTTAATTDTTANTDETTTK